MMQLQARWANTDEWVDVDYVAGLREAKTMAADFQEQHRVYAETTWSAGGDPSFRWFGYNRFVTFRVREP